MKSSIAGKLVKNNKSDLLIVDNENPFYEYCRWINNTIPYLETLEGKTIKPHLKIINQNPIPYNVKDESFVLYLLNRILV